jgi:hypothetical protein
MTEKKKRTRIIVKRSFEPVIHPVLMKRNNPTENKNK